MRGTSKTCTVIVGRELGIHVEGGSESVLREDQEDVSSMLLEEVKMYTFKLHSNTVLYIALYIYFKLYIFLPGLTQYRRYHAFCMKQPIQVLMSILKSMFPTIPFSNL